MQLRPTQPWRAFATAATVLALAVPLTSCGFDLATDRYYTPAAGANNRDADVDVLSAVVVSAQKGSGTFIASLANNKVDQDQSFTALSGSSGADVTAAEFDPVDVKGGELVNLADPPANIVVTGDFEAGSVVPMTLEFANGDSISLNVPVVSDDTGYWEGMDAS